MGTSRPNPRETESAGRRFNPADHAFHLSKIERRIDALEHRESARSGSFSYEVRQLRIRLAKLTERANLKLGGWDTVQLARHPGRPVLGDYLRMIVQDFCELHGDHCFGDDPALTTGFGRIAGHRVMIIGHNRGSEIRDKVARRFGCAHPEGYRKALLRMRMAEKFNLPVVSLIDTSGAYPGAGAEERGISRAIAENLRAMALLRVPIICVVVGEGGSGGALGIGVGDRIAMLRHAYYSVITPEGCAAILFGNADQAPRAAEQLGLKASQLKELGVIDDIIDEPAGGAHRNPRQTAANLETYLGEWIRRLSALPADLLVQQRLARLRGIGSCFTEAGPEGDPSAPPIVHPERSSS